MTALHRRLLLAAAAVITVWHLAALPPTLEDIDSVNFALGVEEFDVARHRPHPPGYPVYILAGKLSDRAVAAFAPHWSRDRRAAAGLSWWSALASGGALLAFASFWRAVGLLPFHAFTAALLAIVCPLLWLSGSRPLSDLPGLAGAVAVQAVFIGVLRDLRARSDAPRAPSWLLGALAAGLLIGVRTQTMWLTGPLLCWCAGELAGRGRWPDAVRLLGAAAVGVFAWLLPMIWLSGGWAAYWTVLGSQGAEDFIGVEMLATRPSWALFGEAVSRTFRTPWLEPALATVVLTLAIAGVVYLLWRDRRVFALLLLSFWPYAVFHITFQETETIRYSLPMVVPIAGLAMIALWRLPARVAWIGTAVLTIATLWIAQPPLVAYRETGAPIFRALADVEASMQASGAPSPTAVAMHRRIASESVQARVWAAEAWPLTFLPSEPGAEVPAVVEWFRAGAPTPLWFLANPDRRDLRLIDPRARTRHAEHRWHPDTRTLVAVARPTDVDTWLVRQPRWMLGHGWAVTPEIGGVTTALGLGPHRQPADVYLLRDRTPLRVVIGARHLGVGTDPAVTLVARLGGTELARWTLSPAAGEVVEWIDLPQGVGESADGPYAVLTVAVERPDDGPRPPVGLEYFDAATYDDVLWAFAGGWFEPEQQTGGAIWRWMSRKAALRVEAPAGPLVLHVGGRAPVEQFGREPELRVRVGAVEVARRTLGASFDERITIPADLRASAGNVVTLETDVDFAPADAGHSADRRRLSLRVSTLTLTRDR